MGLLSFLRKDKNTRKVFGQRELKIIEKQLEGISLTQSEKNRLSRDIRPKLEFIKECAGFKEEFKLKKGARNWEKVHEAVGVILEDELGRKAKEIWLFGSMVENQMTVRSDIDVVVVFEKIDLLEAGKFRIRVLGELSDKMDIQVFNVLPAKIKKEVEKKHRVLYRADKR